MYYPTMQSGGLICIYMNVISYYDGHEPGDIVEITSVEDYGDVDDAYEAQTCLSQLSQKIVGIIPAEESSYSSSNNVAMIFNTGDNGYGGTDMFGDEMWSMPSFRDDSQAVGIKGIGVVKVLGKVKKGQALVSSGFSGSARGIKNLGEMNFSFGFALETKITNDIALVKCYIK